MKKVVKRGNKKNSGIQNRFALVFILVFVVYLGSAIVLKNYNISLNHQLQKLKNENKVILENNRIKEVKIAELTSHERLRSIAAANGLKTQKDAIKNAR